jgi:transcriptional regulator with XRE-family HTH domain
LDEKTGILPTLLWMPAESLTEFKRGFIARTRLAREATGWNQREMAEALNIPLKNYESYETRSMLPHPLIARFCRIARIPIDYLFSGPSPARRSRKASPNPRSHPSRSRRAEGMRPNADKMSEKRL